MSSEFGGQIAELERAEWWRLPVEKGGDNVDEEDLHDGHAWVDHCIGNVRGIGSHQSVREFEDRRIAARPCDDPGELETKEVLDLIFSDHFSQQEPGIFSPIRETLLDRDDYFMHLADLTAYAKAQQQLGDLYADPDAWTRRAIVNVAYSGKLSSDRTISEYASEIWNVCPCPVN